MNDYTVTVSIIVPVYNVEEYLEQCVNSLMNQSYKNIEIILINDKSTDSSGSMCDRFLLEDNRVKVINNKKNMGVSFSRNVGIKHSRGEYLMFVDSDDIVSSDMVERTLSVSLEKNSDLVVSRFVRFGTNYKPDKHTGRIKQLDLGMYLRAVLFGNEIDSGPFCKLYKKSVINEVWFNETCKIGEDLEFIMDVCSKNKDMVIYSVDEALYGYRTRPGSAVNNGYNIHFMKHMEYMKILRGEATFKDLNIERALNYRIFGTSILSLSLMLNRDVSDIERQHAPVYKTELMNTARFILVSQTFNLKNYINALMIVLFGKFYIDNRFRMERYFE